MNKHSDDDPYYSASDGFSSDADEDTLGEHHRKPWDNTHDAWPTSVQEEPMNASNDTNDTYDTNEDRVAVTTKTLAVYDQDMRVT